MKDLPFIVGLLFWISFIVLSIRGKIKIAASMSLFTLGIFPLVIGLILIYAIPHPIKVANYYPQLPFMVSLLIVGLLVVGLIPSNVETTPVEQPSFTRWLFLGLGFMVFFFGLVLSLIGIYTPGTLGFNEINALFSVIINIITSSLTALLLFISSRSNSIKRPNLMRKILLVLVTLPLSYSAIIIPLILIYAVPQSPQYSYPLAASIGSLSIFPFAILIFMIQKEFYFENQCTTIEAN